MSESSITSPSSPPSSPPRYTLPPELVAAAEELLAKARPEELHAAACAYVAYGLVTNGRSAYSGAELPPFEDCNAVARAGWLSSLRALTQCAAPLLRLRSVEHHEPENAEDDGQVDPFILGLGDIAAATRNLADASRLATNKRVRNLIGTVAAALEERVKALAPPPTT